MITKELFGKLPAGADVYAYTLKNDSITSVTILNYGGVIKNLYVADKNGNIADVVCGYDCLDGYLGSAGYQGAIIGRVCNRIGHAKFTLDGKEYKLFQNDGLHTLHGGKSGFNDKIWDVTEGGSEEEPALILTYISPDGEEGFPGTLSVQVTYTLTKSGGLAIHYQAETDKTTVINMTNHAYFNLAGFASGPVDDHILWLDCDNINSVDSLLIADGNFIETAGTPYDFTEEAPLSRGFASDHPMLEEFGGYDNNFNVRNYDGQFKVRATLRDPKSGRKMTVITDQPCIQVYTANMINVNDHPFKTGVPQYKHCAICLETQHMPDAVNHPGFTDITLRPGEKYDTTTVYQFEV